LYSAPTIKYTEKILPFSDIAEKILYKTPYSLLLQNRCGMSKRQQTSHIQGALRRHPQLIRDVGINHGRRDTVMTQETPVACTQRAQTSFHNYSKDGCAVNYYFEAGRLPAAE
jgi:hypothetical protein